MVERDRYLRWNVGLELYMVGVIVDDMPRALEFYRRLGVDVPEGSDGKGHVEVKMSGLTFFLSTKEANARWHPARVDATGDGYRIIVEFLLDSFEELEAKYAELTGFGYGGHGEPYDVAAGLRFALVDDPDSNTILLSAFEQKP